MKVHGWKSYRLADAYTLEELNALRLETEAAGLMPTDENGHPIDAAGRFCLWLYTPATRRKLDAIAMAVYFKLEALRRSA